ncbi:hypothetical protein Fcan01_13329 [Folsomia candida]|uniref:Uncharacterized protein n=1 Tax=Folsomia candida TaxID=158441 RepID=A0A226E2S6_FOLCA|nr:hypothetical protein Fcan01_13329 [Folsomia candida]
MALNHHSHPHLHQCHQQRQQKVNQIITRAGFQHRGQNSKRDSSAVQCKVRLHAFVTFSCKAFIFLVLLIVASSSSFGGPLLVAGDSNYREILALFQTGNDSDHRIKLQRLVSSHVENLLWQVNKLQQLSYGQVCDSVLMEKARHELTDLVAKVTQSPNEQLFADLESKAQEITKSGKQSCDYSRGLACDSVSMKCICYTGHRHDVTYDVVREAGSCKLDEMSRCYSPSHLVSRGAAVIHCINGAKCVGDLTGRRCVSPVMSENCHCQKPCPDGSFTNLIDELKKCISKLSDISVLQFNDSCSAKDQAERDEVVEVLERSGSEKAGPIIRGIKRLLASDRFLCSPHDQLVCDRDIQQCVCGPEKDGILYERVNDSCLWAKGSRCFPEAIFENVTGSNGSCVSGTDCLMEGQTIPCDPNFEEPLCYCQDPADLESSGMVTVFLVLLVLVLGGGGVLGFLVHAKILSCPLGSSPANV